MKTITLAIVGFLIPPAMLIPVGYAVSESGDQPDLGTVLLYCLPPAIGCSFFFTASAIVSSGPHSRLTFVQALFILGTTFIVSVMAFAPIKHYKSDEPPAEWRSLMPFVAVSCAFLLLMISGRKQRPDTGAISQQVV
jgi:hypothetical protein